MIQRIDLRVEVLHVPEQLLRTHVTRRRVPQHVEQLLRVTRQRRIGLQHRVVGAFGHGIRGYGGAIRICRRQNTGVGRETRLRAVDLQEAIQVGLELGAE